TRRPHACPLQSILARGPGEVSRPEDGGPEAGKRHPPRSGEAEEGSEGEPGQHPRDPAGSAGVRADGEGLRHAAGGTEVRPGEDQPNTQPVPDLALEDDRWAL